MRKLLNSITIIINSLTCAKALRFTAAALAFCMLLNITGEAAAQVYHTDFSNLQAPQYPFSKDGTIVSKKTDDILNKAYIRTQNAYSPLSYEQVLPEIKKLDTKKLLTEADYKAIYNAYVAAVNQQDKEVNTVFNLLKKEYNPQYSFDDAYKQGATFAQKHNGSFEGAKVCQDGKCVDYVNYAQGYLRTQIYQGSGADQKKGSKFYWNREVMLAHVPEIYGALKEGGVHRADKNKLQSYLKYVLEKADDYCDNDFYIVDYMPGLGSSFNGKSNGKKSDAQQGKERRQKECDNIGKAMLALGMITETGTERMANAQIIYNIMKDTYKDDYGAITAVNGTAALIAIGSVGSYKYIDRFLTVDTLKGATDFGTVWNGCKWVLNLLSIQSWVERGTNVNNRLRGRGGRYLNQLGAVYQYVDYDASRAMGVSDFNIRVMQTNPSLGYNIAYGNVLEDLGRMIASTGTQNGNAIASRIVNIYASNVKSKGAALDNVHTPLVAGVLAAGTIKTANATYAAQKMNSFDWWDLNEATQRRINNIVAHYSGTVKRSKDQSKVKRNERNQKIIQASVWADMFVSAIFMAMLIASIPNIARNIGMLVKNVSRIRAINAAGKGNLLKITRLNIKAAGVKPAAVKATLNAQRAAKAEQAAVARATRAAQEREAAIKSATQKVRQARVKPQTEQIQYTLLTKEGKSALVNERGVLTAVVGEGGSGASAPAKAASEIKAIKPEPVRYAGYKGTAGETPRVYTPKPSKVVDAARVKKALFRANVDQGVSIVRQLKNSLKTRFGATILAVNMSLTNPAMLTAATSGKAMPIIETLAGTEKVGAFGKSIGGTVRSAATVSNTTAKIVKTPEVLKVAQAAKTPIKALPDFGELAAAAAMLPLAFPKYSAIPFTSHSLADVPYALQTKEEASILHREETRQLRAVIGLPQQTKPFSQQQYGLAQADPIIPLVLLYTAVKKSISKSVKKPSKKKEAPVYKDLNNPASGFFGSNLKLPKGYDKKKDVETYYINAEGNEVKLPLLFNIDKAIKVDNSQRGVFNKDNRLEIRNGGKKARAIEGFCMLLPNNARAKLGFITAVKNASLPTAFQIKLQFTKAKMAKHYKEVPLKTYTGKGAPFIKLLAPKNMVADGETLTLQRDGSLTAANAAGISRTLPDFTFRVPKSEISSLIKVLNLSGKNFVLDVVPTQNKTSPFMLAFLASTTIMAVAPAFKEVFGLSDFLANTIMGVVSFGPALSIPFLGHFFKKYGVTNVIKASTVLTLAGIAMTVAAGFYGYAQHGTSIPAVIAASLGLLLFSLSNEIKFSSMSPVIESNFEPHKALALTTKSLMARSLGTILALQLPSLYNFIAGSIGLPLADNTIAFPIFLLPVSLAAALKMTTTKLREVPSLPENNISIKKLANIVATNKEIRHGALAFTMFESFEATLSLLVFSLAKEHFGELSSMPGIIGGVAIYASMVAGRLIASHLQKKGTLDGPKTLLSTFGAMTLGTAIFAAGGISVPGLIGAAIAFMGASNTFAPLYNVTSKNNPNKSSEISLIFFTMTTLALVSTIILGAIIDATGSITAGFAVPFGAIAGAAWLAKYVFKDMNLLSTFKEKAKAVKESLTENSRQEMLQVKPMSKEPDASQKDAKADDIQDEPSGPDMNNPLPN